MTVDPLSEVLNVVNRKDLAEVGGSHNQKGIEFQRHWAVMRMFELEQERTKDFLLLFEAIQDVAILDSCSAPTAICIYQVKKKDRNEWKWPDLTALGTPKTLRKSTSVAKNKPLARVQNSPLGKLYASVHAFNTLKSSGHFVSNVGCDLPLAGGTNAATSVPCALSALATDHRDLLSKSLATIHAAGEPAPNLSNIHLGKVAIPVDDPGKYIVGLVHIFLENRSARHAGQARALVESLLAKIAPLGARTDTCKTFVEMREQQGYSKSEFVDALGTLETLPDLQANLETWLSQLAQEGMGFMEITTIRSAAASIYRRQLLGARSNDEEQLILECIEWLAARPDPALLRPFFQEAYNDLHGKHPSMKVPELLAHFALQAVNKCVDQT